MFDAFLRHEETRVAKGDLAPATLASHRIAKVSIMSGAPPSARSHFSAYGIRPWSRWPTRTLGKKKTYNNAISALRRAFEFGYRDYPEKRDPAAALKSARIGKKDRPVIDPFTTQEAERLIAALHRDWGEAQGNYDEFRFFTGLRPSEQIALVVPDYDTKHRTLSVTKARVAGVDKDVTKTGSDRRMVLSPRAAAVLERQLALREQLRRADRIDHEHLFFTATGAPIRRLHVPFSHWRGTLRRLPIRYRKPYVARHSSVSWDPMIGRNPLWVAKQHGHSLLTMLRVLRRLDADALETDAAAIRETMGHIHRKPAAPPDGRLQTRLAVDLPVARCRLELTKGRDKENDGGEGGIRTHVPVLPDHPISSRRRYDRFGTSPSGPKPSKTPHYGEWACVAGPGGGELVF